MALLGRRYMSGEKRPRHVESVLRLRGLVSRDRATKGTALVLRTFQVAVKDEYTALEGCPNRHPGMVDSSTGGICFSYHRLPAQTLLL